MIIKRLQNYTQARPLQTWLLLSAFLLTFNLTGYFLIPGTRNPGLLAVFVCLALSPTTSALLQRLSDEQRRKQPVPPEQEALIGLFSVCAAVGSIGAFTFLIVGSHSGLPYALGGYLLLLYSLLALLSVAFGYASRYSAAGRLGMQLAIGWIALLVVTAFVKLLILLQMIGAVCCISPAASACPTLFCNNQDREHGKV